MVNDFVFAGSEQLVHGRRFLVAGDWNVARSVDDRYPGSPGSEFFRRTEERGWFECLPEGGQEVQTWFGGGRRTKTTMPSVIRIFEVICRRCGWRLKQRVISA
jgi:hypothetical protein